MKIALGIEYNGNKYHGWQKQNKVNSIQEELEKAIGIIANHTVNIICGGRTDKGVHSIGQVVHFCTSSKRTEYSWIIGINTYLPKDISVQWIRFVPNCFHARYSAISRFYRYIIYNYPYRSAILHGNTTNFFKGKLDEIKMKLAGYLLIGEHDFSSFRSIGCQSKTPIRTISYFNVFRKQNFIIIDVQANSFLYRMVRNIVGCLIEIGSSKKNIEWISCLLKLKNRKSGETMITASASGLYLQSIKYPDRFYIPNVF